MLIYVAGPYSAPTPELVDANIANAGDAAITLWRQGHAVICPHLNTARMEDSLDYETVLAGDFVMIARCDALYMLQGWEKSPGATREHVYAKDRGIPIFYEGDLGSPPALHSTEAQSPNQTAAFIDVVMGLYRTHLSKNADYSPANILATGEVGLLTRLWDKTARLLNLQGFRLRITEPGTYEAPRNPKHESVDDTYLDLACYAVIGLLLRRGKWGR